jgi:DeoR family transcriptional regulator, suf operon transcriptional repressor
MWSICAARKGTVDLMTYAWEFSRTSAGKVLKSIQRRGQASIKEVATDLGVTPSAVRMHLNQLQARGAVRAEKVHDGVGRPHFIYSVTPEAHTLFHRDYGDLARLLLEEVSRSHGPEALPLALRRVADGLADRYRDQVVGRELGDRVAAWAGLLDERGIAVRIERTDEGFVLDEHGCLYQDVAAENRAVCEMERQVMARLLASGVRLTRCALDGHGGCQFRVLEEAHQ